MDKIGSQRSWIDSGRPGLKRNRASEPAAPQETLSPYQGAADPFRTLARQRLEASLPNPSPNLVEFTALQMAEHKFLEPKAEGLTAPALSPEQPRLGMLGNAAYMASIASAQLACHPALAPTMLQVLGDLDPKKIFGSTNQNGSNAWIIAGESLPNQIVASQAVGARGQVLGFPLTGVLHPEEQGKLQAALQPLLNQVGVERMARVLKNIHLQTMLGEMQNSNPKDTMGGLGGGGQVALARDALLNPERAKDHLGHEIGHLIDEECGQKFRCGRLSDHPDSPFGKGDHRNDFRSDYASRNASEDFAETHADLMLNWQQYKQFPELGILARGKYGEKLAFIARNCYGWQLPGLRPELQKVAQDVKNGNSPLGFRDAKGEVVDGDKHLQRILKVMMDCTSPEGQLDASFYQCPPCERVRRQWVFNAVSSQPNESLQPPTVAGLVEDLKEVVARPVGDPEKARRGTAVLQRLEMGGPFFYNHCCQALGDDVNLLTQLSSFVLVAGPNWQAGTI
ncbi:hypothetical protein JST97_32550 [bacterium]|nr:hypothetical protein [bacterium]